MYKCESCKYEEKMVQLYNGDWIVPSRVFRVRYLAPEKVRDFIVQARVVINSDEGTIYCYFSDDREAIKYRDGLAGIVNKAKEGV